MSREPRGYLQGAPVFVADDFEPPDGKPIQKLHPADGVGWLTGPRQLEELRAKRVIRDTREESIEDVRSGRVRSRERP